MRYTIAIPTHNDFDTIERCIDSVLNVDYDDFEIVISDTSTNEETWQYLKTRVENIDNVRIFRNDENWDMWTNHNFCMEKASGEYILFIHTDDILLEDSLSIINNHLYKLSYPKNIVMWGRSLYKDYKTTLHSNRLSLEKIICGNEALSLFLSGGLTPSGTLVSKTFIEVGGYLPDNLIPPHSDCISMLNCAFNGFKFFMYNDIIFVRDVNGGIFKKIKKEEAITMCKFLKDYFTHEQIEVLISCSFQYEIFGIINFLCVDKQINKNINKRIIRRLIRKPYRLFSYRYITFVITKLRYSIYRLI